MNKKGRLQYCLRIIEVSFRWRFIHIFSSLVKCCLRLGWRFSSLDVTWSFWKSMFRSFPFQQWLHPSRTVHHEFRTTWCTDLTFWFDTDSRQRTMRPDPPNRRNAMKRFDGCLYHQFSRTGILNDFQHVESSKLGTNYVWKCCFVRLERRIPQRAGLI